MSETDEKFEQLAARLVEQGLEAPIDVDRAKALYGHLLTSLPEAPASPATRRLRSVRRCVLEYSVGLYEKVLGGLEFPGELALARGTPALATGVPAAVLFSARGSQFCAYLRLEDGGAVDAPARLVVWLERLDGGGRLAFVLLVREAGRPEQRIDSPDTAALTFEVRDGLVGELVFESAHERLCVPLCLRGRLP